MYVSLTDIKNWLGINSTNYNTLLTNIESMAEDYINNYCWVDSFEQWQYTETFTYIWYWPYFLKNYPATSLDKINDEAVSYTLDTDYRLKNDRILEFASHITLEENENFNTIKFTYTAWYSTLPDDIKLATLMVVGNLFNDIRKNGISAYQQGDLSITYDKEKLNETLKNVLSKYRKVNVSWIQ